LIGRAELPPSLDIKKVGRPSSYDPSFWEIVLELGAKGMSKAQMAAAIGVSRKTLNAWGERHQEFVDAVEWALDLSLAWWESVGQINLTRAGFNTATYALIMKQRFRDDYGDAVANAPADKNGASAEHAEAPKDPGQDHLAGKALYWRTAGDRRRRFEESQRKRKRPRVTRMLDGRSVFPAQPRSRDDLRGGLVPPPNHRTQDRLPQQPSPSSRSKPNRYVAAGADECGGDRRSLAVHVGMAIHGARGYSPFWWLRRGSQMSLRFASGRGTFGASLALGLLAAAELVFMWLPNARPLGRLLELIQLYLERLHPALGSIVGHSAMVQLVTACILIWIASWTALEAFSRATDGLSVWGNIAADSCSKVARGVRRTLCTACKWVFTVFAAPLLVMLALFHRLRYGTCSVTVGFVTFDPGVVMKYIRHLLVGLALVAAMVLFFVGTGTA
jgi:hypothetical protein